MSAVNEEIDSALEGTEEERKAKAEEEIAKKVGEVVEEKMKGLEGVSKLLADPDVRRLLEIKQRGKKVRVLGEEEAAEDEGEKKKTKDSEERENELLGKNPEDLSNQELVQLMELRTSRTLGTELRKFLEPMRSELVRLQGFMQGSQVDRANQELAVAKEKFPDLETYKAEMIELSGQNPGLSIEELYHIAKTRKAGSADTREVETEKPSSSPAKPPTKSKGPMPRHGFRDLVSAVALEEAKKRLAQEK